MHLSYYQLFNEKMTIDAFANHPFLIFFINEIMKRFKNIKKHLNTQKLRFLIAFTKKLFIYL